MKLRINTTAVINLLAAALFAATAVLFTLATSQNPLFWLCVLLFALSSALQILAAYWSASAAWYREQTRLLRQTVHL